MTQAMRDRWSVLGQAVASALGEVRTPDEPRCAGTLTVLGCGITHGDLTIDIEDEIRSADHVFFSINNHVTKSWIMKLRPDSYDMAILYDEGIDRHATYTRMSECILHHVRRGKNVVAVFYGHPGIFAAPGHRAIQIARKEGYHARMRAGISALDHLIADIGFDPATPGMATFEATSLVLRRAPIDTSVHNVIWQVGLVGEHGFDRQGYVNSGINRLADTLTRAYGPDWEVIHYIGAQYAGVEPRVERLTVRMLHEKDVTKKLTTLSTFYIRPKHAAANDTRKEKTSLGNSKSAPPRQWSGDYSLYGPREIATLTDLSKLQFSPGYRIVVCSRPVLDFVTRLGADADMRRTYRADPDAALNSPSYALTHEEKRLLAMRNRSATVVALTGWTLANDKSDAAAAKPDESSRTAHLFKA